MQVLKAVTIPHADLAARVSKLSITEVTAAQADKEYDTVTVVRKMSGDGDDVEGEGDSEDEVEVEMAPDPSGNGALEGTAGQKPARGQKSLRFASMIEQHQGDEAEAGQKAATSGDTTTSGDTKKKFKKPKGSVFIKGEAFDFHGEELTEVDAAALADIENEAEGTPGDGVATSADTQQQCAFRELSPNQCALPLGFLCPSSVTRTELAAITARFRVRRMSRCDQQLCHAGCKPLKLWQQGQHSAPRL